jgi:hypothetical protein
MVMTIDAAAAAPGAVDLPGGEGWRQADGLGLALGL